MELLLTGRPQSEPPVRRFESSRPYLVANIQGIKFRVFISMDNSLLCCLSYRDAEMLDMRPGQNVLATAPQAATWIRQHLPRGADQDRWVEYFMSFNFPLWWRERQDTLIRDAERREQTEQVMNYERQQQLEQQREQEEWNLPEDLSTGN